MQSRLFRQVRELFPNARIYATTHSPFVVASVSDATVFSLRPDAKRRVNGKIHPTALKRGQSLPRIITEVFGAAAEFVDETREELEQHQADVERAEAGELIDWDAFWARRKRLFESSQEARAMVALIEVPVRSLIDSQLGDDQPKLEVPE